MIRKFIGKTIDHLLRRKSSARRTPTKIQPNRHGINPELVSKAAVRTCEVLQNAGFCAYIVGGAVRDLILGVPPKDFDVATDATPDDVHKLFRRSRIIGRRFQIAHVVHGNEIIEVSTFRAAHDEHTQKDEHGRVLRDNIWGSIEEDAARRDFTVNALYYDPLSQIVFDYHNGVAHLKQKRLCMIGDASTRYREDPVRMLRAVRLAAKLGLEIDAATHAPIKKLATLMNHVPSARLFDEMLKLLLSGHAIVSLQRLRREGLHHGLLPLLDVILKQPMGEKFVMLALANTDARVREGKRTSPGFLFATLLWHETLVHWQSRQKQGEPSMPALLLAMDDVLDRQAKQLALTRRIAGDIKEIWLLQPRFERRSGRMPYRLLEQARFRAAWDFLLLRAESGEVPKELTTWWAAFQNADTEGRERMLQEQAPNVAKRRRRKHHDQKNLPDRNSSTDAA